MNVIVYLLINRYYLIHSLFLLVFLMNVRLFFEKLSFSFVHSVHTTAKTKREHISKTTNGYVCVCVCTVNVIA